MNKKLFLMSISLLLLIGFNLDAETITINATRYKLRIYENVQDPPLKVESSDTTTELPSGMYVRWSTYDAEILCDFNVSALPGNAVINSVDFEYKVTNIQGSAYYTIIKAFKNTRDWIGIPQYNDLGNTPWPQEDLLVTESNIFTGWRTFPQNNNFKSLVQEWISNPSSNKGIILANEAYYWGYWIDVSCVRLIVNYTSETVEPETADFKVVPLLSNFAAYATNGIQMYFQTLIQGLAGTNESGDFELEVYSSVMGDVYCGGNAYVLSSSTLKGDLTARGTITKDTYSDITGITHEETPTLNFPLIPKAINVEFKRGITLSDDETMRIPPDNYYLISAYNRSTVILEPGTYNLRELNFFGDDAKMVLDMGPNDEIKINVLDDMNFGLRFTMQFTGTVNPLAVKILTKQSSPLILSHNSTFYGIIRAPNTKVDLKQQAVLYGALYAKEINMEYHSRITKPPVLTDLHHSEWAYAPPFDPNVTKYTAVVPQATDSLTVNPAPEKETFVVSVNGSSPDNIVLIDDNPEIITIEVNDHTLELTTIYTLSVIKDPEDKYAIYVNDNATGEPIDGKSWNTAWRRVEKGIEEAAKSGKEVWVAEGYYRNIPDEVVPFELFPGLELIGSFKGVEETREPKGSVYYTILSGDQNDDDGSISSWPPSSEDANNYLDDNAFHVVMLTNCGKGAISTKIEGFTIQGGCAQHFENKGGSDDSSRNEPEHSSAIETGVYYADYYEPLNDINTGAGFYNSHGSPSILKCVIKRNYSNVNGSGMFSRAGPALIENSLFEENYSYQGYGGGAYIKANPGGKIYGSVFDNNEVGDRELYAGGLFTTSSNLSIINSVFTRNIGPAAGASIYNRNGNLSIVNCTFTRNHGITGVGGIENDLNASAEIINTILWNNDGGELEGDSFSVTYSCVEGGYDGEHNIDENPKFKNENVPEGEDRNYGTMDDGLSLTGSSPCIMKGSEDNYPEKDILSFLRGIKSPKCDQGAYTYIPTSDFLGIIRNGEFIKVEQFPIMKDVISEKEINLSIINGYSRIVKGNLPKNKYTEKKDVITAYIQVIDSYRQPVGIEVKIKAYRVGNSQIFQSFFFENGKPKGKHILFVSEDTSDDLIGEHTYAYLVKGAVGGKVRIKVKYDQFK